MEWKNTDPRFDINKRASIIIIKPGINGREISLSHVDTKDSWSIWTDFEDHRFINVDDKWDESWIWTWDPKE